MDPQKDVGPRWLPQPGVMVGRDGAAARCRVLVTGVGGAPGFDLARGLARLGCEVIAADANPLAAGLALPGVTPRVTTPAGDRDYRDDVLALCRELRPDAILSAVEQELPALIAMQAELAQLGVRTWLPGLAAVHACGDKAAFHAVMQAHGIATPRTWLPHDIDDVPAEHPLVVKPRRGQGGKDVLFCSTREQARVLCELVPDPLVQERLHGREFTADCLVDRTGRASVILRYRLLVKGGLAVVSETFHDDEVTESVRATVAAVGAAGVCCAQGFLLDNPPPGRRRVVITEMNARIAGGFPLSEAAGADLIGQTLNGLFGRDIDHEQLRYRSGVVLTKYIETLAVRDSTGADHRALTAHT